MRTFDSSEISTLPSAGSGKLSGHRFSHHGNVASPPGFGELGLSKSAKSFSTIRRRERVSENLRLTHIYLSKQIDGLSEIQSTLMLWINSKTEGVDQVGTQKIFMQPIENILNYSYRNIPLYGDGTEDPMKLHYLKNGARDYLEFVVVPLLSHPSISSLRVAVAQNLIVPISLLESCGGEVMNQRMKVDSKVKNVDELSKDLRGGFKKEASPQVTHSPSFNILFDFFRRAFGVLPSNLHRFRPKDSSLPAIGAFALDHNK